MPGMWSTVAALAAVVLVVAYLAWTAGRIDRLHVRAAAATRALDAHLVRRAAAAAVLAEELAAPDLYAAARGALDAQPDDREAAENDLTRLLRRLPLWAAEPPAEGAAEAVVAASRRVAVARQVHTDTVRDARSVRRRPLVRLLRLAARHAEPAYFDVDDTALEPARGPAPGAAPAAGSEPAPAAGSEPAPAAGGTGSAVVSGATDQATAG